MTTTHKSPNMAPSKFHVSLWRPSILQKRLWLIWVISLHQSVCQVPKNSKRMHQEWPCVVGVAQGRGLRPYVGGAECLVCQLHCARLGKGFWGLCGYIIKVSVQRVSAEVEKWVSFRKSRVIALTSFQLNWPVYLQVTPWQIIRALSIFFK